MTDEELARRYPTISSCDVAIRAHRKTYNATWAQRRVYEMVLARLAKLEGELAPTHGRCVHCNRVFPRPGAQERSCVRCGHRGRVQFT